MPVPHELQKADLIRPLSRESLDYFIGGKISNSNQILNYPYGKFIRVGRLIVIGADIGSCESDYTPLRVRIDHPDLLNYVQTDDNEEYKTALLEARVEKQLSHQPINDAGFTLIGTDEQQRPNVLVICGTSGSFVKVGEAERQNTVHIAQTILGATVEVGSAGI